MNAVLRILYDIGWGEAVGLPCNNVFLETFF